MKALLIAVLAVTTSAFSIPGILPKNYHKDDILNITVGPLRSAKTGIPRHFYDLAWC